MRSFIRRTPRTRQDSQPFVAPSRSKKLMRQEEKPTGKEEEKAQMKAPEQEVPKEEDKVQKNDKMPKPEKEKVMNKHTGTL